MQDPGLVILVLFWFVLGFAQFPFCWFCYLKHTRTYFNKYHRPVFALWGAEAADGSVPAAEKSPAKAAKAKKQEGLDDGIVQFSLDCNMNQDDTLMNLK